MVVLPVNYNKMEKKVARQSCVSLLKAVEAQKASLPVGRGSVHKRVKQGQSQYCNLMYTNLIALLVPLDLARSRNDGWQNLAGIGDWKVRVEALKASR